MKIMCKITGHKWSGCKCERCGAQRDEGHNFGPPSSRKGKCASQCSICGEYRLKDHDYQPVPGQCLKVCSACGQEDALQNAQHNYQAVPGKCVKVCAVCGREDAPQNAQHKYQSVPGKCVEVCSVCGREAGAYNAKHGYQLVPGKCEEQCEVCGDTRKVRHQYANGKCRHCGADIDAADANGIPPLIWAALEGQVEEVKLLLAAGANVDIRNDETPLIAAARKGYDPEHLEIVELLLAHGADVNATDQYGSSALRLAQRKGLTKAVALLSAHGGQYLGA